MPVALSSHKKERPLGPREAREFYPCKWGGEQVLLIIEEELSGLGGWVLCSVC